MYRMQNVLIIIHIIIVLESQLHNPKNQTSWRIVCCFGDLAQLGVDDVHEGLTK